MRASFFLPWVLALAGACSTNPVTKNSELAVVGESGEIQMGRDIDRYLVATRRFYEDSAWERFIQQFGMRLAATSERPGLPWTFRILDDPGVNAFSVPGGVVYVTRGMLVNLNSEAELAAIMGHEIGHVAARHAIGAQTRRAMEGAGLVAASMAGSMTVGLVGAAGLEALFLVNSRQAEQQADDLGLHYMSAVGYDPMEMVTAFRHVEHAVGPSTLPGWLSSHPSWDRRVENIILERFNLRSYGSLVGRQEYLARLDGLVFGADDRHGALQGRRFVALDRGYQVTFPKGWTLSEDGGAARGESLGLDAVIEFVTVDYPSADSAAHFFFAQLAQHQGPVAHDSVNGLVTVSGEFSWLPLWVKMRGSVRFIEYRGAVYRMIGYAKNSRWSAYREVVVNTLGTFERVSESEVMQVQPLRVAVVPLPQATSLAALAEVRPLPIAPTDVAGINQVPADSVLPAGQVVKWVVGPQTH